MTGLRRGWVKPVLFAACLVPAGWAAFDVFAGRAGANPIEYVLHATGRWGLRFLIAALAVTPLRRWTGRNELVRFRRMLGLYAFFYVSLHLSIYAGVDQFFAWAFIWEDIARRPYITVGFLGWLLLVPLAITSTRGWVRRLGKGWQRLHRLAYFAPLAGIVHYTWKVKADVSDPAVYAALFAVLLGDRVWAWTVKRRRSAAATSTPTPAGASPSGGASRR